MSSDADHDAASQRSDATDDAGRGCGRAFLLDIFAPGTPLPSFLRKLALLNGAAMAALLLVAFGYVVFLHATGQRHFTPAGICSVATRVAHIVASLGPYFHAMNVGVVTDASLLTSFYAGALALLLSVIVNPSLNVVPPLASYLIFAAVCSPPRVNLYYALGVLVYVFHSLNYAAITSGGEPLFALEGYFRATLSQVLMNNFYGGLALVLPVVGCTLQMRHNVRLLGAANCAADLAANAAKLLGAYDTDGVSEALDEYRESPDAYATLAASYETLVDNLNRYRSHLPNWVVNPDCDEGLATGEDAGPVSIDAPLVNFDPPSTGVISPAKSDSGTSHVDANPLAIPSSPTQSLTTSVNRAHRFAAVDSMNVSQRFLPPALLVAQPKLMRIAFAQVDFRATGAESGAATSRFAERVHQVAAATHCAVHTFVGDAVQLSWNAATRAAQPEVKAVRFLIRLADEMVAIDGIVATGAAMSGKATTQFAGTDRVTVLAVGIPWRRTLVSLAAFARQHSTFVVDEATASEANATCELRSVELLRFDARLDVGNNGSHDVAVKEVVSERALEDDEWMYALEKTKDVDPVTAAFNMCVAGHYGDAVAALDKVSGDCPLTAPAVRHLRGRATAALLKTPTQFADPVCGCCF
jgi:hypothetical protein